MKDIQKYTLSILQVENLQMISVLPLVLRANEIQVFTIHIPDIWSEFFILFAHLSAYERERVERFHFDKDAKLFIAAHGFLRVVLAHYLQISPQKVSFTRRSGGKPILSPCHSQHLSLNISHSGETALIGISSTAEIPNENSLLRLVSAILIEISKEWEAGRVYIRMSTLDLRN